MEIPVAQSKACLAIAARMWDGNISRMEAYNQIADRLRPFVPCDLEVIVVSYLDA